MSILLVKSKQNIKRVHENINNLMLTILVCYDNLNLDKTYCFTLNWGDGMKLSTKGRYGVKAMFELALHFEGESVSIKEISEKINVSEYYLEQLFSSLRKAGLIKSIRGAQGGYLLAKNPDSITVADIFNVLEGPIEISDCVIEDEANCARVDYCATRLLWIKISDSVNQVINSISLQDMLNDYNEMKLFRLNREEK